MRRRFLMVAMLAALAAGISVPAAAHAVDGGGGFFAGLDHPVGGLDHLLALVTVGLWAARLGGRALWAVPGAFLAAMAAGAGVGMAGIGLVGVEPMILASLLVLGLLVALDARPRPAPAAVLAGLFALFHGHAHGAELPSAAQPALYAAGFLTASAILLLFGIAAARVAIAARAGLLLRLSGGVVATLGTALMVL